MSSTTLSTGSLVLVTGANGYVASHVVDQLLKAGYRVRGSVRNLQKSAWLLEFFDARHGKGKLELVKVEDLTKDGCLDEAIKGVSALAHVATDVTFRPDPNAVVSPTVNSTLNALRAAVSEPGVRSFVYTSTAAAAVRPVVNKVFHVTAKDWNQADIDDAWGLTPNPATVYGASKTQSEQAAWKFVKENKPSFTFNSILPNLNTGEVLEPKYQPGSSGGWIRAVANGIRDPIEMLKPQYCVDVVDTARLHVAALTDTSIANERILACAMPFAWPPVVEIIKKLRPALAAKVPQAEDKGEDKSIIDTALAEKILKEKYGKTWTTLEESLEANLKGL